MQLAKYQKNLDEAMAKIDLASSADSPLARLSDDYKRDTDRTIVRLRAGALVRKCDMGDALAVLASAAGMAKEHFNLEGGVLSKFFVVKMAGTPSIAAGRVGKLLGTLRLPDGAWRVLELPLPDGSANTPFYMDEDKSKHTIALERAIKKLRKVALQLDPTKDFVARRSDATLFQMPGWIPIAMVESPAPSELVVRFNGAASAARALQDLGLEAKFHAETADPAAQAQWI